MNKTQSRKTCRWQTRGLIRNTYSHGICLKKAVFFGFYCILIFETIFAAGVVGGLVLYAVCLIRN